MPQVDGQYIGALFQKILQGAEIKLLVAAAISTLSFFFDAVYTDAMIAILVLMIFDFITAVAAQKKKKVPIQSIKVFRTAKKIAIYFLLISAGFLAETATQRVLPFIDETIMAFLAVTELISILENVGDLGYAIPQRLLNRLHEYREEK